LGHAPITATAGRGLGDLPSYLMHAVNLFRAGDRISIAFNARLTLT
jgi:hypothetical protein